MRVRRSSKCVSIFRHHRMPRLRCCVVAQLVALAAVFLPGFAEGAQRLSVAEIAEMYARPQVTQGQTVGIGVAIVVEGRPPKFFTYGNAVLGSASTPSRHFSPDTLFEIGSNTKVFTTNLLGQRVYEGALDLDQPLSDFAAQLGTLKPLTQQITLQQLADFTGGIIDTPPVCADENVCLPSGRPTIAEYGAAQFANYFRFVVPHNFQATPPKPVTSLPAAYNYSDFSVGLLGLLLVAPAGEALANSAVEAWHEQVQADILRPLKMRNTLLTVPARALHKKAAGYAQALAHAEVSGGVITEIVVENPGEFYDAPPQVTIKDGAGEGATAVANLSGHGVGSIAVTDGGSGYIGPAEVIFNFGNSTVEAKAEAIVKHGRVIGIAVRSGGANYQNVPQVTITGGRLAGGTDATATAHLVNP